MGRNSWPAALVLCALPVTATADRHKASFGAAGAYVNDRSTLGGMSLSGEWTLLKARREPRPWGLSAVGELGLSYGSHDGETLAQFTYVAGPRFTLNTIGGNRRVQPFGQVLLGRANVRRTEGRTLLAGAFGVGVDYTWGDIGTGGPPLARLPRSVRLVLDS